MKSLKVKVANMIISDSRLIEGEQQWGVWEGCGEGQDHLCDGMVENGLANTDLVVARGRNARRMDYRLLAGQGRKIQPGPGCESQC